MKTIAFAERVAGYATLTVVSVVIEDFIWPATMLFLGSFIGGIVMFCIALIVNLVLIWAYDKIKKDVFAFEALHELTEHKQKGVSKQLLAKFIKAGRVPAFVAISFYDPFLSVIYMRKGIGTYKMQARDWGYFSLGMIIACIGWTFFWKTIFIMVKTVI